MNSLINADLFFRTLSLKTFEFSFQRKIDLFLTCDTLGVVMDAMFNNDVEFDIFEKVSKRLDPKYVLMFPLLLLKFFRLHINQNIFNNVDS